MIVCHCNIIHCHDIRGAAQSVQARSGCESVAAGKVFRELGMKPNCARCVPLMTSVIDDALTSGSAHCGGCPCPTEQDLAAPAASVSEGKAIG
jgi:bacterioferritin-associated ferredoxin